MMHISKTAFFAIMFFAVSPLTIAGYLNGENAYYYSKRVSGAEQKLTPDYDVLSMNLDPIVTGGEIDEQQISEWKIQRAAYAKCPECVASQPFPED